MKNVQWAALHCFRIELPFREWTCEQVCEWLNEMGLECVPEARRWGKTGAELLAAQPSEVDKELCIKVTYTFCLAHILREEFSIFTSSCLSISHNVAAFYTKILLLYLFIVEVTFYAKSQKCCKLMNFLLFFNYKQLENLQTNLK